MRSHSRTASLLIARTGLAAVMLGFVVFGVWMVSDLPGQAQAPKKTRVEEEEDLPKAQPPKKKRVEEEEDAPMAKPPKKKRGEEEEEKPQKEPKRKVIRVEEEDEPKGKSPGKRPGGTMSGGDLKELARQARHPAVKELFSSLAVPYDLAVYQRSSVTSNGERTQREDMITPTPFYLGKEPARHKRSRVLFTLLKPDGSVGKPFEPPLHRLEVVWHYEEIAQKKVRDFLQGKILRGKINQDDPDAPDYLSRYDMLVAAEQALSSVLRWHESARQTGKRSAEAEWASVGASLRKQLLDEVLLEQMKLLADARDWDRVLDLAHRLAISYSDPGERARIFRPVAEMIQKALKDPTGSEEKKQEARKRLLALDREFPGNPAFRPLSETLQAEAKGLLDAAKELARDKSDTRKLQQARDYLQKARETWPELPELQAFEMELGTEHPVLRVGVRGPLPRYFSPAWACTDSERRAVEMLFESLVKLVPDEAGGYRYRSALSESHPRVVPLGRQFQLPADASWSNGKALNSTDIDFSLRLLQNGAGVGRSRVWGQLLVAVEGKKDPFQVTLRMKQGFLDPLALMTFKIVPTDLDVKSEQFGKNPVTSGPFLLDRSRQSDETKRECLFFMANRKYSRRPSKRNAPRIQEIRFYTTSKPVEELQAGKLDLALDLTAGEVQELLEKQRTDRLPIEAPLPSLTVPNRRIYFLAVNHRKITDARLRRALAFAINRESLLAKHFRGPLKGLHRALNGPFPAGSWACNPDKKVQHLFDAGQAKTWSVGVEKPDDLKLKYPQGDPVLDEAMKELCEQVKGLTGVVLEPKPCDPYQLREDVELTGRYDLAYYHYDFPDESYWLAPLLGPPPRSDGGENMFHFNNGEINKLLVGLESYRDFAMVRKYQWEIHKLVLEEMPFIPLWQLDPLLAYRRDVEPSAIDPLLVFNNIEEWRLHRR